VVEYLPSKCNAKFKPSTAKIKKKKTCILNPVVYTIQSQQLSARAQSSSLYIAILILFSLPSLILKHSHHVAFHTKTVSFITYPYYFCM
jgi:hypothetical protein